MGRILIDDYNGRVANKQDVMGAVLPNCGNSAPRNGFKIVEYFDAYNGIMRKGLAGTITTRVDHSNKTFIIERIMDIRKERAILTQERTEYAKTIRDDYEKGCIHARRNELKNLVPRKDGVSNTLTSVQKDNLLLEKKILSYTRDSDNGRRFGIYVNASEGFMRPPLADVARTLKSDCHNGVIDGLRVRKLTPRECFRLMDVSDGDIDRIQASGVSRSQQYRMAGNSIVVSVLFHIFRKMFVDTGCDNNELELF